MSGPKYYTFPVGSAEEAAGIYAQLGSFQRGVRITVEDNQLNFVVSESAWYEGANYSTIKAEIDDAKQRYAESEELKRLLRDKKQKEKARIREKIRAIEEEFKQERATILSANARCQAIKGEQQLSCSTPFGTYDLSSELKGVDELSQKLTSELKALEQRKAECIKTLNDLEKSIDGCNSLDELSSKQVAVESVNVKGSNSSGLVGDVENSIKEKAKRLKNFATFLNKFYEGIKDKDLMGYFDRIKEEIKNIDIFDPNAFKKIEAVLIGIEKEIALLKEKQISAANDKAIKEKVDLQLKVLNDLKDYLKPVVQSIEVETQTTADYTQKSSEYIKECDEILARINELEFVNAKNKGIIASIVARLIPLKNSKMSNSTVENLQRILTTLRELEKECTKGNEIYQEFKKEYEIYQDLYVQLQGFICSGDCTAVDEEGNDILLSPADIILLSENPEEQIEELKEKNKQLTNLLNDCRQEALCGAIAATVECKDKKMGRGFKKEKTKDGSIHYAFVRSEYKGVMFDTECTKDGRLGIYPRGVVLHNGKKLISTEQLKKVHSSCGWADDIHNALGSFGMTNSGNYEEMPEEVLNSLYNEDNYYHLTTREESLRYLELCGYTKEEIANLLGEEDGVREEEQRGQRELESNVMYVDKK